MMRKAKTKTHPFDAAEYLVSEEAQAEYLTAALETCDPAFIADAIGVVRRSAPKIRNRPQSDPRARPQADARTSLSRRGAQNSL